jgi:MFS family permease
MATGGALAVPATLALLRVSLPLERRGRAFGTFGAVMALAAALGPIVGGVLVDAFGWEAVFVANVPVLAFPRFGVWPLAFVSVALLSLAVRGQRVRTGAWLGYLYGLAFLLPLLHWTGIYVGAVPWLILCVAFAAFYALLGAVLPVLERIPGGAVWVGAGWVLEEL